jgi:hypothetical protein
MIKYLLLFLLPFSLYASKILSYNIYDRTDRADVMITFDTPYSGRISQSNTKSKIIIKLEDASIESTKIKKVNSAFLHSLSITPLAKQTQIVASVPSSVKLVASKTSDGYGLRLRFKTNTAPKKQSKSAQNIIENAAQAPSTTGLPTKKDDGMSRSYYIVVVILLIGIFILFYLKRKIETKSTEKAQNNWLFKSNEEQAPTNAPTTHTPQADTNSVSIRFQKSIDSSNSVVMLDFGAQSYLVLMGKGNILLDKFTDNKPTTEQEFNTILQSRHEQLEEFLNEESTSTTKEPLQAYKERAASIIYSEDV